MDKKQADGQQAGGQKVSRVAIRQRDLVSGGRIVDLGKAVKLTLNANGDVNEANDGHGIPNKSS